MKKLIKMLMALGILVAVMAVLSVFAEVGLRSLQKDGEIVGKDTFTQTMVQADGTTVNFYASGDEYFNYLHDEQGYILMRKDGYVYYARSEDGRPVASDVRYDEGGEKVSDMTKMVYSDINFAANPDLISQYPNNSANNETLSSFGEGDITIAQFVIYICFSNEAIPDLSSDPYGAYLDGDGNSLRDYYYQLTYGKINIVNLEAKRNGVIAVYRDSHSRDYYRNVSDRDRQKKEALLLNSAINEVSTLFDLTGLDIDANDDGFIDAVHFLINGEPFSTWGGLLWPHSWDLNMISESANLTTATIGGVKVKDYAFNFTGQLTVGLLAHEFGHILGCPDLYSYKEKNEIGYVDFSSVAYWDLMHNECSTPQFMTTYMRDKYLGAVGEEQIQTVSYNGTYTLKPVTIADEDDVLAYRIPTNKSDEYIMVEYRNKSVTNYDSALPGSGLLVYRITEGVTGNTASRYQKTTKPYELYVYRPAVASSPTENSGRGDLMHAYLSPTNGYFSSVGNDGGGSYNYSTLYLTDGSNTKIKISADEISNAGLTFTINFVATDSVEAGYFNDKLALSGAVYKNDTFSGVEATLNAGELNVDKLKNIIVTLYADGEVINTLNLKKTEFSAAYTAGTTAFPARFVVNAKGNTLTSVFEASGFSSLAVPPDEIKLAVVDADNDYYTIATYEVGGNNVRWTTIQSTDLSYRASIAASLRSTAAVTKDGRLYVTGADIVLDSPYTDVISVGAGEYNVLYVTSDMRVYFLGENEKGENAVSEWRNVIKADGGLYTSYGLEVSGFVYAAGDNADGQCNTTSWSNIVDISAGEKHIVGLRSDGTVVATGNNTYNQCAVSSWTDIVSVAAGGKFTAGLKSDGTVVLCGSISRTSLGKTSIDSAQIVGYWQNVKKLSAGSDFLLALTDSGTVYSTGDNSLGQCGTVGTNSYNVPYKDIVDIAGGTIHSVLLREDGVMLYMGANTNDTNNINTNLLYSENEYVFADGLTTVSNTVIIKTGGAYSLEYAVTPSSATYKKVDFSSNAQSVVTIGEDGIMTGVSVGTATVTIAYRGNSTIKKAIAVRVIAEIETEPMIAVGEKHSVLLSDNGTIYARGDNSCGQLNVFSWGNVRYIAAGGNTTLGIAEDNTLLVAGELSSLDTSSWTNLVQVATDGSVILGVKNDGTVLSAYAAGKNTYGRATTQTNEFESVVAVSISETHTIALKSDGSCVAIGSNNYNQTLVSGWSRMVKVAAGKGFSIGLRDNRTVRYVGVSESAIDLTPIGEWSDIVDIYANGDVIFALKSDGSICSLGLPSGLEGDISSWDGLRILAGCATHAVGVTAEGSIIGAGKASDGRLKLPSISPFEEIPLTDVAVESLTVGVKVGDTTESRLIYTPYNATDRKSVTYAVNTPEIISVDGNGIITGLKSGIASFTATVELTGGDNLVLTCNVVSFDRVNSVTFINEPQKKVYTHNETLDVEGGEVRVATSGGTFDTKLTRAMIADVDKVTSISSYPSELISGETRTVRVRLDESGVYGAYTVTVRNTVKALSITQKPNTVDYVYGEALNLDGLLLTLNYSNGNSGSISSSDLAERIAQGKAGLIYNTQVLTPTEVTILYYDDNDENITLSAGFGISVYDKITGISDSLNYHTYEYGEPLSGSITVELQSGATRSVELATGDVVCEDYNPYIFGSREITLKYHFSDIEVDLDGNLIVKPERVSSAGDYTIKTRVTVTDSIESVEITSTSIDDATRGTVIVYEVGEANDITAKITFAGGGVFDAPYTINDTQSIRLRTNPVSLTAVGYYSAQVYIEILSYSGNGTGTSYVVSGNPVSFATLGLSNVTGASFSSEAGFRFRYGTESDLVLKITDNGDVHYDVRISDSKLGINNKRLTPQAVSRTIFGVTAETSVLFYNYTTELDTENSNIEMIAGNKLSDFLIVSAVMANGQVNDLLPSQWTSDYRPETLGGQNVTIRYMENNVPFTLSVFVLVKDRITEISVNTAPRLNYQVYEDLDLSEFSIIVSYKVNPRETITYSKERFSVKGYDKEKIGIQTITITYIASGNTFDYDVKVTNKVLKITVDPEHSKSIYAVGDELDIRVICHFINGDTMEVDAYVDTFDSSEPSGNEDVPVDITYMSKYATTFYVKIVAAPTFISISPPTKLVYEYGEQLDLSGGTLYLAFQDETNCRIPLTQYASSFSNFNPTPAVAGNQTLTITLNGRDRVTKEPTTLIESFTVYVNALRSTVLKVEDAKKDAVIVDFTKKIIYLNEDMNIAAFCGAVSPYANLTFRKGTAELFKNTDATAMMNVEVKVVIMGLNDARLTEFTVYRRGDSNADGYLNRDDLNGIAIYVANGSRLTHLDFDNSGKLTLTDLVKWKEMIEQNMKEEK